MTAGREFRGRDELFGERISGALRWHLSLRGAAGRGLGDAADAAGPGGGGAGAGGRAAGRGAGAGCHPACHPLQRRRLSRLASRLSRRPPLQRRQHCRDTGVGRGAGRLTRGRRDLPGRRPEPRPSSFFDSSNDTFSVIGDDGVKGYRQRTRILAQAAAVFVKTRPGTETVIPSNVRQQQEAFEARITGRIAGDRPLLDQTPRVPISGPDAVAALGRATRAVTAAAGPGIVGLDPVRIEPTETLPSPAAQTVRGIVGDPEATGLVITRFAALACVPGRNGLIPVGERIAPVSGELGLCETPGPGTPGNPGTPATRPTGCANTQFQALMASGPAWTEVRINTRSDMPKTVTSSELGRSFAHRKVVSVVRAPAEIHAAVRSGARDLGRRLLRRMGDDTRAPRGFALPQPAVTVSGLGGPGVALHGRVEGYGLRGRVAATGGTEAERRHAGGIAAGLTWLHRDGLTPGYRARSRPGRHRDRRSRRTRRLPAGARRADAGRTATGWRRVGALNFGAGEVTALTTLGGSATATCDLATLGAQVGAGWHPTAGDWRMTPSVGLDWTRMRTGAFASGGVHAPARSADRTGAFAGIAASRDWVRGDGVLTLDASARPVHVRGGSDRLPPVSFGGTGLTIDAGPDGCAGLELGFGPGWRQGITEAHFGYHGRVRDGAEDHALTAGLTMRWSGRPRPGRGAAGHARSRAHAGPMAEGGA